jgi:hypothetical protein
MTKRAGQEVSKCFSNYNGKDPSISLGMGEGAANHAGSRQILNCWKNMMTSARNRFDAAFG